LTERRIEKVNECYARIGIAKSLMTINTNAYKSIRYSDLLIIPIINSILHLIINYYNEYFYFCIIMHRESTYYIV